MGRGWSAIYISAESTPVLCVKSIRPSSLGRDVLSDVGNQNAENMFASDVFLVIIRYRPARGIRSIYLY